MHIRRATSSDVPAIARIYNDAVLNTIATFDTEPKSAEERREWLAAHGPSRPVFVAVEGEAAEGSEVIGWASASDWSDRPAYAPTAEVVVYVDEEHRGEGVGTALLTELVQAARAAGIHALVAQIVEGNEVSVRLHGREGFSPVGLLKEVGCKFGRRLDVLMMQKLL